MERQRNAAAAVSVACSSVASMTDPEQIRTRLTAAKAAGRERLRLQAEIAEHEAEQDELVKKHQSEALRIQGELMRADISVERRVTLRQELNMLNAKLQADCDSINQQILTTQASVDEAFVVESTIGLLKSRLMATADPSKLLELQISQNSSFSVESIQSIQKN